MAVLFALVLAWCAPGAGPALGAPEPPPAAPPPQASAPAPVTASAPAPVTEKRIAAASENLDQARTRLREAERARTKRAVDLEAWRQKVLTWEAERAAGLPVPRLERLLSDSDRVLSEMESALRDLTESRKAVTDRIRDLDAQLQVLRSSMEAGGAGDAGSREKDAQFLKLLTDRQEIQNNLAALYAGELESFQNLRTALNSLQENARTTLDAERRKRLLSRNGFNPRDLAPAFLAGEASRAALRLADLAAPSFWAGRRDLLWEEGFSFLHFSVFLAALLLAASRTGRVMLRLAARKKEAADWFSRRRALVMAGRTLALAALAAYLYAYARFVGPWEDIPLVPAVTRLLAVWLFALWGLQYLRFAREGNRGPLSGAANRPARILAWLGAGGFSLYLAVSWALGGESSLFFVLRVAFYLGLGGFILHFMRLSRMDDPESAPLRWRALRNGAATAAWLGAGGALALDLSGYGALAVYWVTSFCRTLVALLWIVVLLRALTEGEEGLHLVSEAKDPERPAMHPGAWLLLRLAWVAWAGGACAAFLVAWGADPSTVLSFFKALNRAVPVGDMRFSALSLVWAVLILGLTRVLIRVFSRVFRDRVLADSGMEEGVKESATTLTSYALWGLGILVALNALGVSATSLTVALGAIGIGLGFGLQNIFSNFVSGIILLFERPIQVGDAVEVQGVWGEVAKINVRSTVIQTYDNASLIIPNSEFISSQVTNWSFKDLRIRRKIVVGVAYGSDVDLVKKLLLQAAEEAARVLKRPKADVLFKDFGDSSLVFHLRFWTHVEFFLAVESEIRFAINRKFAENGVTIPFPQRDLWVKSLPGPPNPPAGKDFS